MNKELLRQVIEELIPFNKLVGVRVGSVERGRVTLEIPFREEIVGDAMKGALHGGVIAMLADTAGGMAVWTEIDYVAQRVSTIDLRIDYLRPGRRELIVGEATVVRVGRSVGVTDMRMFHPSDPTVTVATGKGVYAINTRRHVLPEFEAAAAAEAAAKPPTE